MDDLRDPRTFDRAYKQHAGAMFAAANRVLRDAPASEDVVQDVFMHLWRRPRSFDPARGTLASYLTMMARSRALDRWRTRSVREAAVERTKQAMLPSAAVGEDAAEPVNRREGRRAVMRALERLPGAQREAVVLAFGGELTAREIACAVDVPLGTAKSRVRLGLQKARAELSAAA